eukprot:6241_1
MDDDEKKQWTKRSVGHLKRAVTAKNVLTKGNLSLKPNKQFDAEALDDDAVLSEFIHVMDTIYGKYTKQWKPKPYEKKKPRYLWTDAFGVVNYLTLYVYTKDETYLTQAQTLVSTVHDTLGYTRDGQKRLGHATDEHPTLCGLRIGKLGDESSSMDGDGQYFHYLTKWMFALNRLTVITEQDTYNTWAIEMAKHVFERFVNVKKGRMCWKMNIGLDRILVPSEGNLDPYDGYVTYRLLQETANDANVLSEEIKVFKGMVDRKVSYYNSNDTLDLGEACWLAHWFVDSEEWAARMAVKSMNNLNGLKESGEFKRSAYFRLAFREFGTAIGTQALYCNSDSLKRIKYLSEPWHNEIVPELLSFWKKKGIYARDRDITPIMYCSSLIPGVWCR